MKKTSDHFFSRTNGSVENGNDIWSLVKQKLLDNLDHYRGTARSLYDDYRESVFSGELLIRTD